MLIALSGFGCHSYRSGTPTIPTVICHVQRFDIVILDEATQMTEPLSLAALVRARAKHLIIAGDPCQLGPIIATPAAVTVEGGAGHQ